MKQQATQMMWFYDRQHEQWSLSDHLSCQPWQGEGAHPWASQLAPEDESGFADFLARLHHSGQPGQFIGLRVVVDRSAPWWLGVQVDHLSGRRMDVKWVPGQNR